MVNCSIEFLDAIVARARQIQVKVELTSGSTVTDLTPRLQKWNVERTSPDGMFFGYCVSQYANVKVVDIEEEFTSDLKGSTITIECGVNDELIKFPTFFIENVERDGAFVTFEGYDWLGSEALKTHWEDIRDRVETQGKNIRAIVNGVIAFSEIPHTVVYQNISTSEPSFTAVYPQGIEFEAGASIREVVGWAAEALGAICFMNNRDRIVIKRLVGESNVVWETDRSYLNYVDGQPYTLNGIINATELDDEEAIATLPGVVGITQIIRENPFLAPVVSGYPSHADIQLRIEDILNRIGELTISTIDLTMRGCPALELGDRISILNKDTSTTETFIMSDSFAYDGGLTQKIVWANDGKQQSPDFPSTVSQLYRKTYAVVDKVNNKINMVVSDVENSVKSVVVEYYSSTSVDEPIGGSWSTVAPAWQQGRYMWSRQTITRVDGTIIHSNETCISGAKGADGTGRSLRSLTSEYYASTSPVELAGGEWSTTEPDYDEGKFIWTRSRMEWDNPTEITYTEPVYAAEWKMIDTINGLAIANNSRITQTRDEINACVEQVSIQAGLISDTQEDIARRIANDDQRFTIIEKRVETSTTADQLNIAIAEVKRDGVEKVETATGFKFDKDGLNISKTGAPTQTQITENGMTVSDAAGRPMLVADSEKVVAERLSAKRGLTVDDTVYFARIEDSPVRFGCFWIGG